jgi:hypothetical protein
VYILERLAEDLAYSDSVAGNPKAPPELLARLAWNQDGNSHTRSTVRAAVARNFNTSPEILAPPLRIAHVGLSPLDGLDTPGIGGLREDSPCFERCVKALPAPPSPGHLAFTHVATLLDPARTNSGAKRSFHFLDCFVASLLSLPFSPVLDSAEKGGT